MELVRIRTALPTKLAELAEKDEKAALRLLQDWDYGLKSLRVLWEELN